MQVVSVNVGKPRQVRHGGVDERTAIYRQATIAPVAVSRYGLADDEVGSNPPHGGADQAVYLYGADDYRWWEQELGRPVQPGTFGENLSVEGFRSEDVRIGDCLLVGETVVLEVAAPRTPCVTLARRMDDRTFIRRFMQARRPGAYARVLAEGVVCVGDRVGLEPVAAEDPVTLVDLAALHFDRRAPIPALERALLTPVAERWRPYLEERLQQARARQSDAERPTASTLGTPTVEKGTGARARLRPQQNRGSFPASG